MSGEHNVVATSGQGARLIAYLSLCMLAVAFGSLLDPFWCRWWAIFGAFGLASALGLDVLGRSRTRCKEKKRIKRLSLKAQQDLDKMKGSMASSDAILAAVRRIQPDTKDSERQRRGARIEPRAPFDKPVTITPISKFSKSAGQPFTGRMRNISRHGCALSHDRYLDLGRVLLEFELKNGEQVWFIAELLWVERQTGGQYHSGGKLLQLVSASDAAAAVHDSQLQATTG